MGSRERRARSGAVRGCRRPLGPRNVSPADKGDGRAPTFAFSLLRFLVFTVLITANSSADYDHKRSLQLLKCAQLPVIGSWGSCSFGLITGLPGLARFCYSITTCNFKNLECRGLILYHGLLKLHSVVFEPIIYK